MPHYSLEKIIAAAKAGQITTVAEKSIETLPI